MGSSPWEQISGSMSKKDKSERPRDRAGMTRPACGSSLRPYRGWLIIVFVAMLIETAMSIAAPWPLKIILDNVVGSTSCRSF